MTVGYTKLFSEIIMSTVWREPDHVRILWITMLALKDRWHVVNASLPGLADAARMSIKDCEKALKVLSSPDPHSRSEEYEGRRIEKIQEGWLILNGEKYRNKMSLDERREYQRIKQREYRERQKALNSCQQSGQQFTHTEADTDTETKAGKELEKKFILPDWIPEDLWKEWLVVRSKKGAINSKIALTALVNRLDTIRKSLTEFTVEYAIKTAIEKSWKSVELEWLQNLESKSNGRKSKLDEAIESIERHRPV